MYLFFFICEGLGHRAGEECRGLGTYVSVGTWTGPPTDADRPEPWSPLGKVWCSVGERRDVSYRDRELHVVYTGTETGTYSVLALTVEMDPDTGLICRDI